MSSKVNAARLLWLDMEMTGLDIDKEVPIEVAAIVTDYQLNPLGDYHSIIKQAQNYIDSMDAWNKSHHGGSGLTALIPSGKEMSVVDVELTQLIRAHFSTDRAILAGNSIAQDKLFLKKYFPSTDALLHYRMMDVTSWKVMFNGMFNLRFKKKDGHRALDDIHESINELKYYLSFIDPKRGLQPIA